jgi:hypothetical protein
MNKIIFTDVNDIDGVLPKPKPATEYIPDWYKDAKSYTDPSGKKAPRLDGKSNATVKRCMPVWDMMTAGYIIETPYDIYVRQTEEGPYFQWGENQAVIFQDMEQFQNHPYPWSIKTPKGWSIMVMEPQHREPGPIVCASGIVDTDSYFLPINTFLKLRDPNFEGMIPAGTPLLQVIPFKRESWVSELGSDKERKEIDIYAGKFKRVFFDRYKKFSWNKKEYK